MEVSIEDLREIAKLAVESDLQVLYLEVGDVKMGLSKTDAAQPLLFGAMGGGAAVEARPAPAVAAESQAVRAEDAAARPATADAPPAPRAETPPSPAAPATGELTAVKATSLGVVYRRPAPDQPPFVEVGAEVRQGETVCLIEVMKTYNRVEAPCDGRVAEICAADGTMVERGETLMRIEPLRG